MCPQRFSAAMPFSPDWSAMFVWLQQSHLSFGLHDKWYFSFECRLPGIYLCCHKVTVSFVTTCIIKRYQTRIVVLFMHFKHKMCSSNIHEKTFVVDVYIKTLFVVVVTVTANAVLCKALDMACSHSQCRTRCCRWSETQNGLKSLLAVSRCEVVFGL